MGRTSLISALYIVAVACASAEKSSGGALIGEQVETVCFSSGLSGFSQVRDDVLLLKRTPTDRYLVQLGFCPNLKSIEGLKIDHPDKCLNRGSRLLVYDTPLPLKKSALDKPDRCLVLDLKKIGDWPR